MNNDQYNTEAVRLAKAIGIAIDAFETYCPENFKPHQQQHMIDTYKGWKESALQPEQRYRNLTSLKYDIENVFTYFQEGTGPTVEYFWKRISEEGLDYARENKLKKILQRGKIRGRIEYDYVTDMLVVAQQVGMINQEEAQQLNDYLAVWEKRK